MTKKILLILGILIVVGVAIFLVFTSKPQTDGESRVGFSIRDYLPFGSDETGAPAEETKPEEETPVVISTDQPVPRLRKISGEPVAGAVIFNVGTTSVVRFVEKGTGNVYEAKSDTVAIQRLTNTTIPKIIRASWLPNGSGFLAQTLVPENELIETSFVKLNKNTASSTNEALTPFGTTIGKLPTGIKEISIKPDGSKIFYYTASSLSKWFTGNPDGTGSVQVMVSPLTEWVPKWVSGNTVIMQTKGSSESVGYTYSFDLSSKVLKKIGVGISGISSNPNSDGSLSLVSGNDSSLGLFVVSSKNASSTKIMVSTLAEKCVWLKEKSPSVYCAVPNRLPGGNFPDIWYKGLVSTEDSIQKIGLADGIFADIADLSSLSDQKIDVVDMSASPDETHLIFRNKIDGYLWMLRIEE